MELNYIIESSSSSDDSFIWMDASNDSDDHEKANVKSMGAHGEEVSDLSGSHIYDGDDTNANIENHSERKHKKSKKRKGSMSNQEWNGEFLQPERERIKLEPESDIEARKMKKKVKDLTPDNFKSILDGESNLDLRVKQEQISAVAPEDIKHKNKKKHKSSHTDINNINDSPVDIHATQIYSSIDMGINGNKSVVGSVDKPKKKKKRNKSNSFIENEPESAAMKSNENGMEGLIRIGVKQEEASVIETEALNCKKKKKRRNSIVESDTDITSDSKSLTKLKDTTNCNDLYDHVEDPGVEHSVIDEKFIANETVVEKPRKKKHKKSNSFTENDPESAAMPNENGTEGLLNMRVKQEEASVIKTEVLKCKKKKKRRNSIVASDTDITNDSKSIAKLKDPTNCNDLYNDVEDIEVEHAVIEEKFSADETVVEKPKKKKHKKDNIKHFGFDNDMDVSRTSKENSAEENNYNDTSLRATDFTCNNIVSSTIINSSSTDIMEKRSNKLEGTEVCKPMKISDRIMFEEDEYSSNQELHFSKYSDKIRTLLRAHPQLKLCSSNASSNYSITEDDEIWLLRWPHEIDIQKLKNANLTLKDKCKIKINGQTYDGIQTEDVNRITLLTYQHGQASVSNLPVKGCIDYRKRIPKNHIPVNSIFNNQVNFIPLPDTKCRHPLFGAHYKKAIKIPAGVAERLKAAKEPIIEASCHSKKKKKHKHKSKSLDIEMETDLKTEYEPAKKKRKRKHDQDDDAAPRKTKRIKHDPDSAEVWESEQAIEENLFNF